MNYPFSISSYYIPTFPGFKPHTSHPTFHRTSKRQNRRGAGPAPRTIMDYAQNANENVTESRSDHVQIQKQGEQQCQLSSQEKQIDQGFGFKN